MASTLHVFRIRLLAVALLVPAVLFVTVNLLRYQVGVAQPYDTLSPLWSTGVDAYQLAFNATVLPGLAIPVAIGALAFGAALVGVMGIYLIAENPPCTLGRQLFC